VISQNRILEGVTLIDGRWVVDHLMIDAAKESIRTLRENANIAEEQALIGGNHRRKALSRVARDARSLAINSKSNASESKGEPCDSPHHHRRKD